MGNIFERLKQRKLVQWALAYGAGAWVLLQVLGLMVDSYEWPHGVMRVAFVVVVSGFLITIVLAWYHGERGEQRLSRNEMLLLAVLLVLGGGLAWRTAHVPDPTASNAVALQPIAGATAVAPKKSIAVLPFVNMSGDKDNEYFSDGMSEEILNALVQVKDLKVAGRTSSFYYKGRNEDLRSIGKALGVANILEGSVRKQGDKVRITAQLIEVSDDTHLWSHDYDGDLSDVFQLQDNIARAITDQLKVVLTIDQKAHLVQVGTTNTDAYNLYLQATDALNHRDYRRMGDAIGWLGQAIQLDQGFAQAHARLAMIHVLGWPQYGSSESEAQRQAQIAFALDPKLAETQYVLGFLARKQRRLVDAREAIERAIVLAPNDASANFYYAQHLINTGYTRQGIVRLDRALAIDPMLPNALHWRALQYLFADDTDTAERLWKRAAALGLSYANVGLAAVAQSRGDFAKARSLSIPNLLANPNGTACLKAPETSVPTYFEGVYGGDPQERKLALAVVDECLATRPTQVPLWAAQGLYRLDKPERALQVIAQGPTTDDAGLFNYLWSPQWSDARRLPEFAGFARKVGFAELWDRYGPPDLCRRKRPADYACE